MNWRCCGIEIALVNLGLPPKMSSMAQGLHLTQKMALQQVLAPQLQQSLALLQAPMLELKALVEHELQQNPVLEELSTSEITQQEKREIDGAPLSDPADPAEPPSDITYDPATDRVPSVVDDFQAEFERLAQVDQEWRDSIVQANSPLRAREEEEERRQYMFDSLVAGTSLQEQLLEQVRLSDLTDDERAVAEMIIGNIDDAGYLRASLDELAFSTSTPIDRIAQILKVVQSFHPPGVGARDLRECLLLQLERAGRVASLEYAIVDKHMEALGRRRFPEIARALGKTTDEVQQASERISHLEPRPGRDFMPDDHLYVVPEVFVRESADGYTVSLNNEAVPHLRISNTYKDLMANPDSTPEVRDYIREKIRAGKFLIKSLHQRQHTISNIAREIVGRQREFMDQGVAHLRPMTMAQVAEAVGVHETTVSRAVSGKYMDTPQGVFEMKYFFTAGIPTANGEGMSNASVKGIIANMIGQEDRAKPLSDEEIVKRLDASGIIIARRTVAKYRSELNILPSHLRKVY
ncbi:MAG TPA: RNA polymerase factor sigma-54 [Verrucomicrobiota bacterium]|nr:RNA polymerase factor sigma-54 [Verrucomicrobiota bacterium]